MAFEYVIFRHGIRLCMHGSRGGEKKKKSRPGLPFYLGLAAWFVPLILDLLQEKLLVNITTYVRKYVSLVEKIQKKSNRPS